MSLAPVFWTGAFFCLEANLEASHEQDFRARLVHGFVGAIVVVTISWIDVIPVRCVDCVVSGQIVSEVHVRAETRYLFTLRNKRGLFYVLWQHPDWAPRKGQRVLVRGSVYSVLSENGNITRIQADEVVLLGAGDGPRLVN